MMNAERVGKATRGSGIALQGTPSRSLRAPADQRSAPHRNRSAAEMPQERRLDKLG